VKGNSEALRVLRGGGRDLAVIWDRLENNPASQIVHEALAALYPDDPPLFLARTPFGYSDAEQIERDMRSAGFDQVDIETVELSSFESSPLEAATGLIAGCPLRAEVEARDPAGLERAIDSATEALKALNGPAGFESRLSAHIVTATR
jgi:hypothetical protein